MARIETSRESQSIAVFLEPGEQLFCRPQFRQSGTRGDLAFPPYPCSAPLGRLRNRVYWLHAHSNSEESAAVDLGGLADAGVGAHRPVFVPEGRHLVVDLSVLVGFVVPSRGRKPPPLRTWFRGIGRLGFWVWGHPLPCVFEGPVTVLLYAPNLRHRDELVGSTFFPRQLVAYDPGNTVIVAATEGESLWQMLRNSVEWDNRITIDGPHTALLRDRVPGSLFTRFMEGWVLRTVVLTAGLTLALWLLGS